MTRSELYGRCDALVAHLCLHAVRRVFQRMGSKRLRRRRYSRKAVRGVGWASERPNAFKLGFDTASADLDFAVSAAKHRVRTSHLRFKKLSEAGNRIAVRSPGGSVGCQYGSVGFCVTAYGDDSAQ